MLTARASETSANCWDTGSSGLGWSFRETSADDSRQESASGSPRRGIIRAGIGRAGAGESRQREAEKLYEESIKKFDGSHQGSEHYFFANIEKMANERCEA